LDTFYNALNPVDQDSLNSAVDGDLLERRTQDVLMIIKNKSKIAKLTHAVNQQTSVVTTAMTAILKQFQATLPPAFVKAVEEICITCGGAHPYYQCLAADGNTFPELRDNIQGYVSAAAVNYNQGNSGYRPPGVANQIQPSGFAQLNVQNNQNRFSQPQGYNRGNNFNQNSSYQAPMQQNQVVPLSELEKIKKMNEINMKAMQIQINNVKNDSTSGSGPLSSNTIANPKGELKAITTRSDIVLDGPFVPMSPPFINSNEDEREEETLTDPELGEFTIKVPPPLFQKPKPSSQRNFILHQRDSLHPNIPYPLRMHKQKQQEKDEVQIHKFWQMFKQLHINITLADALILIPKVPLILERPFLRTACALIDVHGEEMILRDDDERLTLNMIHDTSSYSNQPQKESINMINIYDDSCEDFLEDLFATNHLNGNPTFSSHTHLTSSEVKDDIFDQEGGNVLIEKLLVLDPTKNLPPPYNINPLSGSTTSSLPNHLLKDFADELALITFPPRNDDLPFDIESNLKEIEYLLNHDPIKEMNSILEDSIDKDNLADLNNNLFDTIHEMFTDEHTLDYSSPPLYDDYDDDLNEFELSDFLPSPEYDSFLFEDFSEVDALPSTNNKDKASLILEDFDPPLYELLFHKEVLESETLLSFSFENKEKVFKPRILTSKGVHSSLLPELSHRGPKAFKVIKIFKSPMDIFPCSFGEDIRILDVPCLHFYPSTHAYPYMIMIVVMNKCVVRRLASSIFHVLCCMSRNSQIVKTRARVFVLRSLNLHIISFILGTQYPNLIDIFVQTL
nr:hypothetical protein [Tanacetum cinerariifolium]